MTDDQSGPPRHGVARRLVATIFYSSVNNAALAAGRFVLPLTALGMGAGPFLVGVMAAFFPLAPLVLNVRFGRWVDRIGSLVPFLFASALIVVSGLVFLGFPHFYTPLAVAGLIGAGAVFSHVAATRAVTEISAPPERTRNLGFLVASYSFFQFLGPVLAGLVFERFGAGVALAAISAMGLFSILGIATGVHAFAAIPKSRNGGVVSGGALDLMSYGSLGGRIIISAVFSAVQTIYPLIVSLHSVNVGLPASIAGLLLGAFAIGTVVSRLFVGMICRLFDPLRVLVVALVLGAVIYALIPFLDRFYPLLALSFLAGMPIGIGVPIALNLIYEAAPEGRANESIGLCMTFTNLMQAALPLALGLVAAGMGVSAMVWILSVTMLATAFVRRR